MKRIKGFTLIECLVGILILGIIASFIIPSLIGTLKLEKDAENDRNLYYYSKNIVESIKSDYYNNKNIDITNNLKEEFDFKYEIKEINNMNKLEVHTWRKDNSKEVGTYEVLLP